MYLNGAKNGVEIFLAFVLTDKFDGERKNGGAKSEKNLVLKSLDIERMKE